MLVSKQLVSFGFTMTDEMHSIDREMGFTLRFEIFTDSQLSTTAVQ